MIDKPPGLRYSFVSTLLLSILKPLFLPSATVSVSYFFFAVSMSKCLGKHSCMSSSFPIAMLSGACFCPAVRLHAHGVCSSVKGGGT